MYVFFISKWGCAEMVVWCHMVHRLYMSTDCICPQIVRWIGKVAHGQMELESIVHGRCPHICWQNQWELETVCDTVHYLYVHRLSVTHSPWSILICPSKIAVCINLIADFIIIMIFTFLNSLYLIYSGFLSYQPNYIFLMFPCFFTYFHVFSHCWFPNPTSIFNKHNFFISIKLVCAQLIFKYKPPPPDYSYDCLR